MGKLVLGIFICTALYMDTCTSNSVFIHLSHEFVGRSPYHYILNR
jgi:hypothetical protein